KNFEDSTAITSMGDSQSIQAYTHLDRTAPNGLVYYQLSQTDLNGLTEILSTISLQRGERALSLENVYPIPAERQVSIHFQNPNSGQLQLKVMNIHGQEVFQSNSTVQSGLNELQLDVNNWSDGVYILQLEIEGQQITSKIVVR
ncbi:MAG: T9SS type A sorting domain-containing protein, partial [Chitinophagales bacterium]